MSTLPLALINPSPPVLLVCTQCANEKEPDQFYGGHSVCRACYRGNRALERMLTAERVQTQVRKAMPFKQSPSVLDRLRRRAEEGRPSTNTRMQSLEGLSLTAWGASSYTEIALGVIDSHILYFEAFVELFEERVEMSEIERSSFNTAVQLRMQTKLKERGRV